MKYRDIWKSYYGEIPKDEFGRSYEIHHIDGNRKNNSIENLKCVSLKEHYEIHLEQGDLASAAFLKQKMGTSVSGWKHSDETKQKIKENNLNNPRRYWLGKKRPDISVKQSGRFVSEETKQKQSEAKLKNPTKYWEGKSRKGMKVNHPTLTCPYCGKIGKGESAMNKWHFDKCKLKK